MNTPEHILDPAQEHIRYIANDPDRLAELIIELLDTMACTSDIPSDVYYEVLEQVHTQVGASLAAR